MASIRLSDSYATIRDLQSTLSIKSGGSWSGSTFTATMSVFNGKITKTASISSSAKLTGGSISTPTTDGYSILDATVEYSINGVARSVGLQYSLLNVKKAIDAGYKKGWNECLDACIKTSETYYERSTGTAGGPDITHYTYNSTYGTYSNQGKNWYHTSAKTVYTLEDVDYKE